MSTTSIDDLLMGGKTDTQPATPEHQYQDAPEEIEELEAEPEPKNDEYDDPEEPLHDDSAAQEKRADARAVETDDYGNEKEPVNEAIRERLARQARKHQAEIDELRAQLSQAGASREVQKAASDFEYDPSESGDWQQQLASFVKQTVSSMNREQNESVHRQAEEKARYEFETKFRNGMNNFDDFVDVVQGLPFQITDAMTLSTRAMTDPAAFLYAAAKRQPAELERIAKIRDPYAQITEMGKLEERMRRNKPMTKAPRPLGRTTEDSSLPAGQKSKEPSIEDLIAKSEVKKLARMKARSGGRR